MATIEFVGRNRKLVKKIAKIAATVLTLVAFVFAMYAIFLSVKSGEREERLEALEMIRAVCPAGDVRKFEVSVQGLDTTKDPAREWIKDRC